MNAERLSSMLFGLGRFGHVMHEVVGEPRERAEAPNEYAQKYSRDEVSHNGSRELFSTPLFLRVA
jgi:hypothetical protein